VSRHSTTLRPDIRFRHVYVDVQCARCLDGIAAARLMILPGADHMFTLVGKRRPSRREAFLTDASVASAVAA
jgi:hypothetical protein